MKPESITYRYEVKGDWEPFAVERTRYQPDTLLFGVLVTSQTGEIEVCDADIYGRRIGKDGALGTRHLIDSYYTYEQSPEFAKNYFDTALRQVRDRASA